MTSDVFIAKWLSARAVKFALTVATVILGFIGSIPMLTAEWSAGAGYGLVAVAGLAAGIVLFWETRAFLSVRFFSIRDQKGINGYMREWITTPGRTAVFTRDMTWVRDDAPTKAALLEKARRSELFICMPEKNDLAGELEAAGATVHEYPELEYSARSRFTIIRHEGQDARVAVGRAEDEVHAIEEYGIGRHPAFTMAEDLVALVSRLDRMRA